MKLALALAAVLLTGCLSDPESMAQSSNPQVEVQRLFQVDGCQVYRFADGGRPHYFARCGQQVRTIGTYSEPCGKNCRTELDEDISTETTR